MSVGYLFRVKESVGWPVNNFLLCCLHKKWSWRKRAEDVSICLTLISKECYEVAIHSVPECGFEGLKTYAQVMEVIINDI